MPTSQKIIERRTIPVVMDKSHLITIGERMYSQSLELIRELVCNAYDADATHVWIAIDPYVLSVRDNGSGMDEAGMRQYLTIGSQEKRYNVISPIFKRKRIGEFGIGKFAAFSACDVFMVHTQKGNFAAKITFDKNLWSAFDNWEIPFETFEANSAHGDGTTVTLERLKKELTLPDIERFLRERVPLKMPNFNVYLNGKHIEATTIPGKKFQIRHDTSYGTIRGEIVIPNLAKQVNNQSPGIECFVNGVPVTRETFGFEFSHMPFSTRITGEVHADFIPITSDRSRFMIDAPEYKEFYRLMRFEISSIIKKLKAASSIREEQKADAVLRDALSHIRKALKKNPEFAPKTQVPVLQQENMDDAIQIPDESKYGSKILSGAVEKEHVEDEKTTDLAESANVTDGSTTDKKPDSDRSSKKIRIKTLNGKEIIARRMHIGEFSIVCKTENIGETGLPVLVESGVILINRDHPLFKRFSKNQETLTLYITELIAQEISKKRSTSAEEAFHLQNQILGDAWA